MSAKALAALKEHVATAESPDDCNTDDLAELGTVSLFGGHLLTPSEVDAFCAFLQQQATIARRASARFRPSPGPGPTQDEWERAIIAHPDWQPR